MPKHDNRDLCDTEDITDSHSMAVVGKGLFIVTFFVILLLGLFQGLELIAIESTYFMIIIFVLLGLMVISGIVGIRGKQVAVKCDVKEFIYNEENEDVKDYTTNSDTK